MNPLERTAVLALVPARLVVLLAPATPAGTAVVKVICPSSAYYERAINWRNEMTVGDVVVKTESGWGSWGSGSATYKGVSRDGQAIRCQYQAPSGPSAWYSYKIKRQIIECKRVTSGYECTVKD